MKINKTFFTYLIKYRSFSILHKLNKNQNIDPNKLSCSNSCPKYQNADVNKSKILKENRNKVGIYRWVNNINNKTYIGSSVTKCNAYFSTCSKLNFVINNNSSTEASNISVSPEVKYPDAYLNKTMILKDNKNKAGIYRWVNKVNGNTYIGSSTNLRYRLSQYYRLSYIDSQLSKSKSRILCALLKYGYTNFQLEILEYCTAENSLNREQYYIDLLKPEYNINPVSISRFGTKHSIESREKMSKSAQGRKHSEQTKDLISHLSKGINNPNFGKTQSKETKALISAARLGKSFISELAKAKMSENNGTAIRVLNITTNETYIYPSIKKAAEAIGISQPALSLRFKTKSSFIVKKLYQVEKVKK